MVQINFLALAWIVGFAAAGPVTPLPCCKQKKVGGVSYSLVEEADTSGYKCIQNCVYQQDGKAGSRYCFAAGELEVACEKDDAISIDFDAFKKKYMKVYSNDSEEAFRSALWKNKTDLITEHNKLYLAGRTTYRQAEHEFITMTYEELEASYLGLLKVPNISSTSRQATVDTETLPSSVDWRTKGYVTPVKNQGGCGSCWAFSATGAMEGAHFKESGTLVSLSESNLVDCSGSEGNQGCNGGWPDQAFQYVLNNKGIDTEAAYPYVPTDQPCKFDVNNIGTTITGWTNIQSGSEADLQNAMAMIGPVSIAICADANFGNYESGIFYEDKCMESSQCNGGPNHAVLVVGYGSNADGDYWIVKNSWGPDWGLGGYIWMARNRDNNCGIASYAVYPIVD